MGGAAAGARSSRPLMTLLSQRRATGSGMTVGGARPSAKRGGGGVIHRRQNYQDNATTNSGGGVTDLEATFIWPVVLERHGASSTMHSEHIGRGGVAPGRRYLRPRSRQASLGPLNLTSGQAVPRPAPMNLWEHLSLPKGRGCRFRTQAPPPKAGGQAIHGRIIYFLYPHDGSPATDWLGDGGPFKP